jgi:hypothetical protein
MHKKSLAIAEKLGRQEGMANHYGGNHGLIYETQGSSAGPTPAAARPTQQYRLHGRIEFPNLPAPRRGPSKSAS